MDGNGRRVPGAADLDWGPQVLAAVREQLRTGTLLTNGARELRSWSTVEDGRPVLYLAYRHPRWGFDTGLRRWVDEPTPVPTEEQTPQTLARSITDYDIGQPPGTVSHDMVPDRDGVWWWGDPPLPGDTTRRGPAPVAVDANGDQIPTDRIRPSLITRLTGHLHRPPTSTRPGRAPSGSFSLLERAEDAAHDRDSGPRPGPAELGSDPSGPQLADPAVPSCG